MTKSLVLVIPGTPVGKGRPRFSARGKYVHTYTPEKTAAYENLVKIAFAKAAPPGFVPYDKDVPLEITIKASFVPADSLSKKKKAAMLRGEVYPTKIPDIDNLAKSILDGLHEVCYKNDSSVVKLSVEKLYSSVPEAVVVIREIDGEKSLK